ncbi:MAG TPA: glycosyltransferase family 39 protein [Acidobacteriaceae bacterium]|jgi:tetratricopeptide (TPR) repeat protein|nr:glycosyltransferase family 39 protein [Acidobacteriaceae bacterium]
MHRFLRRLASVAPAAKVAAVVLLLAAFGTQLVLSSQRNSVTWDEGHHLYSGYRTLTHFDYGLNPEVPPLVKMVAALPLLNMPLTVPPLQGRFFKDEAFLGGKDFLFDNDFESVLFRARMASAVFSFALALLIFFAARRMFSTTAALIALALFVFDPNFLAHGALVTTDVASAFTLFATVYAFYRWRLAPTRGRLFLVGLAAGLALVTKFTGILVVPILLLLAWCEVMFPNGLAPFGALWSENRGDVFWRIIKGLPVIAVIAYAVLWAFYGFRFSARPRALALHPAFADYVGQLGNHMSSRFITLAARWYLLPQSWLYGLADTKITADSYTSYFRGHVFAHGHFLYFPAAFAIKSTPPFLVLLLMALVLIVVRQFHASREILYLTLPALLYFLIAATSNMNIGFRHLLPIYPFLYILVAGAAAALIALDRRVVWAILALVAWQAADAVWMYPAYMAFGNDLWGGPTQVHLYLSDANVDWGQQLNDVRDYLAARGIRDPNWVLRDQANPVESQVATPVGSKLPAPSCYFVYFPDGVVDPSDYGVPCHRLPTADTLWWLHEPGEVPPAVQGLVLISDSDLAGIEFGEGPLNPYEQFRHIQPVAVIDYGVYVYEGRFDIPLAAGLNDAEKANALLKAKHPDQALIAAKQAVALAPDLVNPQAALGDALTALHRPAEARVCYQRALALARTVEPQLQTAWVPILKKKLGLK